MPVIPEFENDVALRSVALPTADAGAFGKPGAALAQGFGQLSDQMAEFNQRYTEAKRATGAADTMVDLDSKAQDLRQRWSLVPDRQKAFDGFAGDMAKLRTQSVDTIQDPFAKNLVAQHFDQTQIIQGETVKNEAFKREAANSVGNLRLQIDDIAHQYAAAKSDFERAQIVDAANVAIKSRVTSGYMDGDEGAELLIHFRSRADAADATRDIDADPINALEKLNDNANYPNLDEWARGRLIARAESKSQRVDALSRGSVEQRFNDNLESIERTGEPASALSPVEIYKAFPEHGDEMMRQLNLAGGLYQATQASTLTSPQEDRELLSNWQPRGEGFADQAHAQDVLKSALDAKYKALDSDPAAYVLHASPEISALYDAAAKDPKQTGAAIAAMNAAYDKLGIPTEMRNVLPKDAAQGLATSIMATPEQAPATMKQLEGQYGAAWPQLWRELTTTGKLPPAFQAVPTLDNERDGALLARWLGQVRQGKTETDLLGDKATNAIKNSVRSDPGVQSLISSLSRSGSSTAQTEGVLDAIDSLAYAKNYFDRDPQAAQNAISSFTSKYEFMPNGGARVPRENYDAVSANAEATLKNLTLDKIAVPDVYGKQGMPKADEFFDQLKASPTWITSPNADALWLMDTYGRFVRDKNGKPISVPFNAPAPNNSMLQRLLNDVTGGSKQ